MMKYSAVILLFAAAVFWSSASARPRYNPVQGDSGSDESLEIDTDELVNTKIAYTVCARFFVSIAPPAHQSALVQKYEKALEGDYEDFADFEKVAVEIFEKETGLDMKKIEAEYENEEKYSNLVEQLKSEWLDILKGSLDK